ncbi:hypothetical protein HELRODRAFT_181936 [Helobdella robusta]|uniref:Uncharacterized protein n=1 Tax=Helobdella robusta TaxID=6412 RepID=T1FHH1_HELRO|nr:hypothetical protein HELRODRAFT_181936 [Helobdella robusta]ESN92007.1 hypothetical protein HELRODRAFT_181936 [Helobdella robusta]
MAQLITDGSNHGVHPFVCQLRDVDTHLPLSGIELGDIGTKQGWNGIDNGYLRLDNVRVPRTNMLMKYFVVHKDGRYERIGSNDKAIYSTLIYARSLCASFYGGRMVIMAASVAIRHCLVMKCDKYGSLFENRFVKNTLVTELASGLAIWLAGNALSNEYKRLLPRIMDGDSSPLPALHAISSGYKALSTYLGPEGVERCRRCCGQVGGLVASGLPIISETVSPGVTIDGDNTVMYLQLARYLVKLERRRREDGDSKNERGDDVDNEFDSSGPNSKSFALHMIKLHGLKSQKLIEQAYDRMTSLVTSEGLPLYEAWNRTSVDLVQAAEAYTISYAVKSFYDVIMSCGNDQDGGPDRDDEDLKNVLFDVLCLFAVHSFVSSVNVCYHLLTDKLPTSNLSDLRQSIDKMVDKLAPNALALSDGLDLSDAELDTCIGTYCGNTDADIFNYVADVQPYNAKPDLLKPVLEGLRNYFKLRSRL